MVSVFITNHKGIDIYNSRTSKLKKTYSFSKKYAKFLYKIYVFFKKLLNFLHKTRKPCPNVTALFFSCYKNSCYLFIV